ncbi:ankyrin repeat-containing domain protein [Jimgerdemannia flammicorona]|uniref:Ankyrin repeat-containing domain protein n=1 Tax=Jimgerdemannia flammicorona TaxID=994334 RepID=A0A433AYZ7_9FUNG|nr:ankyrin repeat-containing domain protein [Jimgerdemannia flammicorona]
MSNETIEFVVKLGYINILKNVLDGYIVDATLYLRTAVEYGHFDIAKYLIDKGANVHIKYEYNTSILHMLAGETLAMEWRLYRSNSLTSRSDLCQILKIDADIRDDDGVTPLHYASFHRHHQLARVLLAGGADINGKNNRRQTPLHYAVMNGDLHMVKWLYCNGANMTETDNDGLSPHKYAINCGNHDMCVLIERLTQQCVQQPVRQGVQQKLPPEIIMEVYKSIVNGRQFSVEDLLSMAMVCVDWNNSIGHLTDRYIRCISMCSERFVDLIRESMKFGLHYHRQIRIVYINEIQTIAQRDSLLKLADLIPHMQIGIYYFRAHLFKNLTNTCNVLIRFPEFGRWDSDLADFIYSIKSTLTHVTLIGQPDQLSELSLRECDQIRFVEWFGAHTLNIENWSTYWPNIETLRITGPIYIHTHSEFAVSYDRFSNSVFLVNNAAKPNQNLA